MLTESNPETGNTGANGTVTYTYDSASAFACVSTPAVGCGDLIKKQDNAGNTTNYTYDNLHRVLTAGNSLISGATLRSFVYDSASGTPPTGWSAASANAKTQLIEARTANTSGTTLTDEWFSYSARGELTDLYESTPHSSGYYHTCGSPKRCALHLQRLLLLGITSSTWYSKANQGSAGVLPRERGPDKACLGSDKRETA